MPDADAGRGDLPRVSRRAAEAAGDGHTDASGKESYNEQLSLRRAKSVGKVLTTVGMKEENIQLRGLGSSQPVASNDTAAGRTENRRVSIVVTSD